MACAGCEADKAFNGTYIYPYYGVAPHRHKVVPGCPVTMIGSTVMYPEDEWPSNYEDVDDGCGVWYCPNKDCCNSKQID